VSISACWSEVRGMANPFDAARVGGHYILRGNLVETAISGATQADWCGPLDMGPLGSIVKGNNKNGGT